MLFHSFFHSLSLPLSLPLSLSFVNLHTHLLIDTSTHLSSLFLCLFLALAVLAHRLEEEEIAREVEAAAAKGRPILL